MSFGGDMHIKILIKDIRTEKKITLSQLSAKTGVSVTHINDVENGLKEPGLSVAIRIAKALKVPITDLYKVLW